MPLVYTIDLRVDPLVAGWIDRNFNKVRGCYRMGDSFWYGLVSSLLYQSHVKKPTVLPEKYSGFVPIKLAVTEYDFYHYGWEVSPMQELRFSRLIRSFIIDECLRNVAIMRARYDIPLSQAITDCTVFFNLEEEHLKYETLRKIYQRKYQEVESRYRDLDIASVSEFGANDRIPDKRSLRLRGRAAGNPRQLELFT